MASYGIGNSHPNDDELLGPLEIDCITGYLKTSQYATKQKMSMLVAHRPTLGEPSKESPDDMEEKENPKQWMQEENSHMYPSVSTRPTASKGSALESDKDLDGSHGSLRAAHLNPNVSRMLGEAEFRHQPTAEHKV